MNPWLSIPLADYEAHMALPDVAQAPALASEFGMLLRRHRPESVAVLGCSGGNGLEQIDSSMTRRVVALDINPAYVAATAARFGSSFADFEPIVCEIGATDHAPFRPVGLIFAGLLLEYVPLSPALRFIRSGLEQGGTFGCVIQQESPSLPRVSSSPFATLSALSNHMHPLSPLELDESAARAALRFIAARTLQMPNGKVLVSRTYLAEG